MSGGQKDKNGAYKRRIAHAKVREARDDKQGKEIDVENRMYWIEDSAKY